MIMNMKINPALYYTDPLSSILNVLVHKVTGREKTSLSENTIMTMTRPVHSHTLTCRLLI